MKKYRRSFWAASCVNSMIIPWIVAFVFSYLSVKDRIDISRVLSFYGLIFGGIPTLVILAYFFVSEFYVILSDDGPSIPFMKIATTKAQRSGRYYLDRVRLKDFPEIIDFLREKGIEVYVKGMECFK